MAGFISTYCFSRNYAHGLIPFFSLNEEQGLPNFWSSILLIGACMLLLIIALAHKVREDPFLAWMVLAIVFLYLGIDEAVAIHERLTDPVRKILPVSGFLNYAWVIPYGLALMVFVASYIRFFMKLPPKIRTLFLVSGVLYVSGAMGLEMVEGRLREIIGDGYNDFRSTERLAYAVLATIEECFENLGVILFVYALLKYIADVFGGIGFNLKNGIVLDVCANNEAGCRTNDHAMHGEIQSDCGAEVD